MNFLHGIGREALRQHLPVERGPVQGGEGGMGSECLMDTEFRFGQKKIVELEVVTPAQVLTDLMPLSCTNGKRYIM